MTMVENTNQFSLQEVRSKACNNKIPASATFIGNKNDVYNVSLTFQSPLKSLLPPKSKMFPLL